MHKHYSNEYSSAEVVKATALPDGMDGVMELVRVWTDPLARMQGSATDLMIDICEDADITGTVLMLSPRVFGRVGFENLAQWYERFGFTTIQRNPVVLMARTPQVFKAKVNPMALAANEATCV